MISLTEPCRIDPAGSTGLHSSPFKWLIVEMVVNGITFLEILITYERRSWRIGCWGRGWRRRSCRSGWDISGSSGQPCLPLKQHRQWQFSELLGWKILKDSFRILSGFFGDPHCQGSLGDGNDPERSPAVLSGSSWTDGHFQSIAMQRGNTRNQDRFRKPSINNHLSINLSINQSINQSINPS